MSDVETPIVTEEQGLTTLRPTTPLIERWLDVSAEMAVERVEKMVRILEMLRRAAILQTYPSDWVIHTTMDHDGTITKQVGYLQDTGADRAGKVFGIEIDSPIVEKDETGDTFMYRLTAPAIAKVTGERIGSVIGSRWSGDPFFTKQLKEGEKVDPTDVFKAAYANLHGRAVRALAGLGGVPLDVLETVGLDVKRCQYVGYGKGTRGGESVGATGPSVIVAFGKSAGKMPSELEDKDLAWYLKSYSENVANEGKARFKKANQRVLDELTAEQTRRQQVAAHAEETGKDDMPDGSRGQKLTDLRTRLVDACKNSGPLFSKVTRALGEGVDAKIDNLSDLTDEQLDKLARIDDATLEATVKAVRENKT